MDNEQQHAPDRFAGWVMKVLVGSAVVVAVSFLLFPMLANWHPPAVRASCQSQMNQIGKAIKTYLSDWDDCYPSNRPFLPDGSLGSISASVRLSKSGTDENGRPIRNEHGLTWVEGLYNYVEPITSQDDDANLWKCTCEQAGPDSPAIRPPASKSAAVSYVMNRNLIEKYEAAVRNPSTLMMVREVDRLVDSELRPINDSTTKGQPPVSAFLTTKDARLHHTNHMLHSSGSNVLFADGHVKLFHRSAFSDNCTWDPKTKTWGNAERSVMVSP